ncbi:unnamed protein product [Clonostachys rhizophaga]|uniref:Uncharacterized protein n=1 Tax=Clonostachys rhizophaga TaxID=160324 RepID=A0A9N9VNP3_9HYPO|nr:unnamed protein product [Clonostachys rhizophaga]
MASSSREGPQLAQVARALNALAVQRRNTRANNIGLLDLIKGINDEHEASSPSAPSPSKASSSEARESNDLREIGVITVKSPRTQIDGPALTPLLPRLTSDLPPVARRDFTSVRLHQDVVGGGKFAFELIEADPSSPMNLSGDDQKIRHLNVVSDVMDFHEFRAIALKKGNLVHSRSDLLAITTVLQSAEKLFKKGHTTWYMKPGTLLRCDVDHKGTIVASATFVSIPYVRSDSVHESPDIPDRKGVCVPRNLDEILHPHDSSLESELSQACKGLWVGEAWMIIVNDTGILTYGGKPCQDSLMNNIEIKKFAASSPDQRMVQVTKQNGLQFQIPVAQCSSLFIMEAAIQYQLEEMKPRTDPNDCAIGSEESKDFNILRMNGDRLTSVVWSYLVHAESPALQVKLEQKPPRSDDSESDLMVTYNNYGNPQPEGRRVSDHTVEWVRQQSLGMQNEHASQSIGSSFEDVDFAQIASSISDDQDEDSELDFLDLDAASPPVFTWGSTDENRNDMRFSIEIRVFLAETYLNELFSLGALGPQEDVLGAATGSTRCTLNMLKREVNELMDLLSNATGQNEGRFQEQALLLDYHDFCTAAIRFLEAFIPSNCSTPGLHMLFNALYKGFKAPEFLLRARSHAKYIILYEPGSGNALGSRTRRQSLCQDCLNRTVYMNLTDAFAHLRMCHYAELPPDDMMDRHVTELGIAAEKDLNEWNARIVKQGRDLVVKLAHEAGEIQYAAIYADLVHNPPWENLIDLLDSFIKAVSSMFSLSYALDGTSTFYHVTVHEKEEDNLDLGMRPFRLIGAMDKSGDQALKTLKKVQIPLAAKINKVQSEDLVKLFAPVGVHELATQMVCNLVTAPVHVNPDAVEPYQIVKGWQQQLLTKMRLFAHSKNTSNARATFAQARGFRLQKYILEEAEDELQDLPKTITSSPQEVNERRLKIVLGPPGVAGNENVLIFETTWGLIYGIFLFGNGFYFLRDTLGGMYPLEYTEQYTPLATTPAIISGFEYVSVFLMAIALPWYYMKWFGTDDAESI